MRIARVESRPPRRRIGRAAAATLFAIAAAACGAGVCVLWNENHVMAMSVQDAARVMQFSHDSQDLRAAATIVQQEAIRMVDLLRGQATAGNGPVAQDARNFLGSIADRAKE